MAYEDREYRRGDKKGMRNRNTCNHTPLQRKHTHTHTQINNHRNTHTELPTYNGSLKHAHRLTYTKTDIHTHTNLQTHIKDTNRNI